MKHGLSPVIYIQGGDSKTVLVLFLYLHLELQSVTKVVQFDYSRGILDTTLCNKVYPHNPVSYTNKNEQHDKK